MATTELTEPPPPRSEPLSDLAPPGEHDFAERVATGVVTGLPMALLLVAAWQAWDSALHFSDLIVFALMYAPTSLGITVGYHRMLTHRSFKSGRVVRALFAAFGSAAIEGPPIEWVANHRMHHRYSDEPGDPHSPHVGHGVGWRGALRGLYHAHLGWLFHSDFASEQRYAPDLLADPTIRFVDRLFLLWVALGLVIPFALGLAITGRLTGGLTALLWGGAVRIFLLHHVTFSINSLCHFFGRRSFDTGDHSRNLAWLAPLSMGEAWHNNHHAFPTSASHGLRWWEVDPSALLIKAMARAGLVWDVVEIAPERQAAKRLDAA